MSIVHRNILKNFFATGKKPNALQFQALLDSYVHILDDRFLLGLKPYDTSLVYKAGDTTVVNKVIYQTTTETSGTFNPAVWIKLAGAVEGGLFYKGTWDAQNNIPNLNSIAKSEGDYYVVSVAGNTSLNGITDWQVGDWAIYNGTAFEKIDNTDGVTGAANTSGGGNGLFKNKQGTVLEFKTITNNDGSVNIVPDVNDDALNFSVNFDDSAAAINRVWSSQKTNDELDTKLNVPAAFVQENLPVFNSLGQLTDSGYDPTDFMPSGTDASGISITPISGIDASTVQGALEEIQAEKMPKTNGVANNFPYFDGTGLIYNSGYNFSSFLPATTQAVNIPINAISGLSASNVQTALAELQSIKITKVTGANGKLPLFDSTGALTNSGLSTSDFLPSTTIAVNIPVTSSGHISGNVQSSLVALDGLITPTQSGLSAHIADLNNPHAVTKAQVGLGNVTNDQQLSSKHYAEKVSFGPSVVVIPTVAFSSSVSLATGDYYFEWYFEYTGSSTSLVLDANLKAAGVSVAHTQFKIRSTDDYDSASGFTKITVASAGSKDFVLEAFKSAGGGSSNFTIRNMKFRVILM